MNLVLFVRTRAFRGTLLGLRVHMLPHVSCFEGPARRRGRGDHKGGTVFVSSAGRALKQNPT